MRGILLFGKSTLYVLDHFCANEDGEISEIESEESEHHAVGFDNSKGRVRWPLSQIRDFLKRSYLLMAVGLEVDLEFTERELSSCIIQVFRVDGRSMYIVLESPKVSP